MASLRRIAHRPPWWLWLPVDFLILAILLASRTEESIEGVWTVDMGRECYLDYHTKIHTVAPGLSWGGLHQTLAATSRAALAGDA